MDDLLQEFLTESHEHLDTVDRQMIEFEIDPSNDQIVRNIFRLVHTIKGTCGFLGLHRLERLAHSGETLLGQLRDGVPVTPEAVTLILASIDRIKMILGGLERSGAEPAGNDDELIAELEAISAALKPATAKLSRPLKPDEVSLDELERAFLEAEGPDESVFAPAAPAPVMASASAAPASPAPAPALPERSVDEAPDSRIAAQTIRVQVGTLEHLMTMVSELVLTRNQLLEIARRTDDDASFKATLQRLSHITAELQDNVMKTRMQPIGNAWNKLPRMIRDLSAELGKKIELILEGANTELDRQVLEQIKDPLTHLVRNAADHGIELPMERMRAGKSEIGRIRVSAGHEGGSISIRIADDGKGLDIDRIRGKAQEAGLANPAEIARMTDAQVARFIFHAGLTTAAAVTNVSGRGVGMDVVKSNIDAIGGTIVITSEPGHGATFVVRIPLTLAIVSALIVAIGEQRYAIPQAVVRELVRVRPDSSHTIERLNGASVLRLRERLLPVVSLSKVLASESMSEDNGFVVVTQIGQQQFGILVDGVLQTEEIVVKPMSGRLKAIPLFSGNTILGDGAVVLILDPNGLARTVGNIEPKEEAAEQQGAEAGKAGEGLQTILVFQGGGGALKAVPLSLVTRLEEIDAASIEYVSGRALVQYRGRLMPLIPASERLELQRDGLQPLVIFSDGHRTMGLAVEAIVDIMEARADIELANAQPGVLGSAVIGGRATEMIDLAHYLPQAFPDWLTSARPAPGSSRDVLLVEQSEFLREMLAPVIRAAGYHPICCAGADQARAALGAARPLAAIIVDVEHPASGGLEVIAEARGKGRHADVTLLGLASAPHVALMARSVDAGLRDIIGKFDRHSLMAALGALPDTTRKAA
jgi:two-component system chemotaxis sensor kinase CheA